MKADDIEIIVNKLLSLMKTESVEDIHKMEEFNEFKTQNRLFYETITGGSFQPLIFKEMMKMKRRLENGEDQFSVDSRFGKFMAGKYIDPVIKN